MSIKYDLQYSIKALLNNEDSFATQAARKQMLMRFAEDLVSLGYGLRDVRGQKEKHIVAIVQYWQKNRISIATLKNRTATLRYLYGKINKPNIIPKNDDLNIGKRPYKPSTNKAIHNPNFINITDSNTRISLEWQRAFGLRREESIKIKPHLADKCTVLGAKAVEVTLFQLKQKNNVTGWNKLKQWLASLVVHLSQQVRIIYNSFMCMKNKLVEQVLRILMVYVMHMHNSDMKL
jgi:hypothetical protein